jgi:histidinol phosphatase-like PHP family hydrolase
VKFHLLSGSLEKLYLKKKYSNLFDIGVLSIHSANNIKTDLNILFKHGAAVHVESADYMIIFKPDQRKIYREKISEKAKEANWIESKATPFKHHQLFLVNKPAGSEE